MGPTHPGAFPRHRSMLLCGAAVFLACATQAAQGAPPAEMTLSSSTYVLYFERDRVGKTTDRFAPVYEYLSGDVRSLGGRPLSFHFHGWGRIDLGDDSGGDRRGGDLGSAYLRYLHPAGNGEIRAGRFLLAEGAANEIMDGLFVKVRTASGIGLSAFGGIPVERSITGTRTGDSIYGGRLFFARTGFAELGASYLFEKGPFQAEDRKEIGGDLWLRPAGRVELVGRATYNEATRAMADERYVLRLFPAERLELLAGYEAYRYRDLFQRALNPAFVFPAPDNSDRVRIVFAAVEWEVLPALVLEAGARSIRHDREDPGDATRGEFGVRYLFGGRKDAAGLSGAVVRADRAENEYREARGFASLTRGAWRLAVDLLARKFEEPILGKKNEYAATGSAGVRLTSLLRVSGDLTYTRSPQFKEDYAGLLRVLLDLRKETGGAR